MRSPQFSWNEPYDWGWAPDEDIVRTYTLKLVNKTDNSEITKNLESTVNSHIFTTSLSDGQYEWSVIANLGNLKSVSSEPHPFSVCTVNKIADFTLDSPNDGLYTPQKEINFTWNEPYFEESCVDESLYEYVVKIYDSNDDSFNTSVVKRGQNSVIISLDEEEVYSWEVVANGPGGVSTSSNRFHFTYCTKSAPGQPIDLHSDKSSFMSCEEAEKLYYTFTWTKPDSGKNCHEPKDNIKLEYTVQLCTELSGCKNKTTNETHFNWNFTCENELYNLSVWAYNDYDYSEPGVISFNICKKTPPGTISIDEIPENYCSTTTHIKWELDSLGDYCVNTDTDNKFEFTFTSGGNIEYDSVVYDKNGSYEKDFALSEGEWNVNIVAVSKNGLKSSSVSKSFTASMIPKPQNLDAENLGTGIRFKWETDDKFMDCSDYESYGYILEYSTNETNGSVNKDIEDTVEVEIKNISGVVKWKVKLVKGGNLINVVDATYNTDKNCVPVKPSWSDSGSVLKSPVNNEILFDNVTFKWEKAKPGIACKAEDSAENKVTRDITDSSATNGYYIYINEEKKRETTDTICTLNIDETGSHEWHIVAFTGDVVSDPTESMSFCIASSPMKPKSIKYNPYEPDVVSWESVDCKAY